MGGQGKEFKRTPSKSRLSDLAGSEGVNLPFSNVRVENGMDTSIVVGTAQMYTDKFEGVLMLLS